LSNQIQDLFEDWNEIENQIKALRQTQSELLGNYAKSREVKKGDIVYAFKARKRLLEKQEDMLDIVVTMFQELEMKEGRK